VEFAVVDLESNGLFQQLLESIRLKHGMGRHNALYFVEQFLAAHFVGALPLSELPELGVEFLFVVLGLLDLGVAHNELGQLVESLLVLGPRHQFLLQQHYGSDFVPLLHQLQVVLLEQVVLNHLQLLLGDAELAQVLIQIPKLPLQHSRSEVIHV
jgi:hypothetical protein